MGNLLRFKGRFKGNYRQSIVVSKSTSTVRDAQSYSVP